MRRRARLAEVVRRFATVVCCQLSHRGGRGGPPNSEVFALHSCTTHSHTTNILAYRVTCQTRRLFCTALTWGHWAHLSSVWRVERLTTDKQELRTKGDRHLRKDIPRMRDACNGTDLYANTVLLDAQKGKGVRVVAFSFSNKIRKKITSEAKTITIL
jgi:hypothetical protein